MQDELSPRKIPKQERSRLRVEQIMIATRALLVEVGMEQLTCENVALRAGVPIGSLYQYFPNKFALVCELDRAQVQDVQAELAKFAAEIPTLAWVQVLEKYIDHLAELWMADPSRRAVWLALQSTPQTRSVAAEHERILANQVVRLLAPLTPGDLKVNRQEIAEVVIHTVYSMLNFSIRDQQSHPEAVKQLKAMLTAYLISSAP